MEEIKTRKLKNRENEKGAVMVMVLLISFLLLIASAGILLEASMNTANVSDATADQQAYNAAESGIQSALNVLRGNVKPNPLFNSTTPSSPDNEINYIKALKVSTSNSDADAGAEPRLSRWGMTYTSDRVAIGDPTKGYAYRISLVDPDDTSSSITYSTVLSSSGIFDAATATFKPSKTFVSGANTATITYNPAPPTVLNVSSGASAANFGNFQITIPIGSAGATIPDVRFQIVLTTTKPYEGTRVMRGTIKAGTLSPDSVGTVKYEFDSPAFILFGSTITLDSRSVSPNPANVNGGQTAIDGSMTQAEPLRILIRSIGFGPRGARKQLEAMVQKNYFDGLSAPAALTMVGSSSGFVFEPGNSNRVSYSGDDVATAINIPSIGVTNNTNLNYVINHPPKNDPNPPPADVAVEMPDWLTSPAALDKKIQELYDIADKAKRLYVNGQTPPNFGDNYTARGITFIDGDASFRGSGGGILVCTGKLTLNGGVDFNGLIIVTGAGGFDRSGGGGGTLQGNTVIAPYAKSRMVKADGTPADKDGIATAPFLGPKYDISGGGNSELRYNSSSVNNGLTAVSNIVLGVAEK